MNIEQAKELDMVDYLARIGFQPHKPPRNHDYWYVSPFHDERTPSFKVNRKKNRWYDFSLGKGGNLVDFGVLYHQCSVSDFLARLDGPGRTIAEHKEVARQYVKEDDPKEKIQVIAVKPIVSLPLLKYLRQRRIAGPIAFQYLKEVTYELKGKQYYALGFQNNAGGYELRNAYIKAASSPKSPTFFENGARELAVFEGFFNFLSYLTIHRHQTLPHQNYLVLNSTSFFEKMLPKMQAHERVRLFLDNDNTGHRFTAQALSLDPQKFVDERKLYLGYDDLNHWHVTIGQTTKHYLRQRP